MSLIQHSEPPSTQAGKFLNVRELVAAIERFIAAYNEEAMPFARMKIRVIQKTPEIKC